MAENDKLFDEIGLRLANEGAAAALQLLVDKLLREKRYHELFDVRRMQCRQRLGLSPGSDMDLDELEEPLRGEVEDGYLAACREVGKLLLDDGEIRQAWLYLRTSGDDVLMRSGLAQIDATEENIDEIIETAVYEGVDVARGFRLLLEHYGTCNAITTFESALHGRKTSERTQVAAILVEWLHDELLRNLLASFEGQVTAPDDRSTALHTIAAGHEGMFGEYTVHVDASHLSSVVRIARVLDDATAVALALDLTEYGLRLHDNFQHPGEPPFQETYRSHRYLYAAQLGREVEEATNYFRQQAEKADVEADGTLPAEVYILLLARLGRFEDAITAHLELLPASVQTTGFAPDLLELSRGAGDFERLLAACRQRGDLLGYAVGKIEERQLADKWPAL